MLIEDLNLSKNKVMEINELMIGNWVIGCSGEPFKIGIIDPDFLYWDEIKPIPLTTEILEKNGFIKESRDCFDNPLQYCVLVDGLWIDISGENYFEGKLEYVHQLQNALRICGIKKEIEL